MRTGFADARDCHDILQVAPSSPSGEYTLVSGIKVYCDMKTAGGGWTVSEKLLGTNPQYPLIYCVLVFRSFDFPALISIAVRV